MNIKKYTLALFFSVLLIGIPTSLFSQNERPCKQKDRGLMSRKEFMEKRSNFIVKESGLTKEETKTFLTVWDELHQKQMEINDKIGHLIDDATKKGLANENEYHELINQMSESKIDKANLDKEYMDKMLQVISAKKLFKVLGAEMKFRRRIFKQYGHESGKRRAEMNP